VSTTSTPEYMLTVIDRKRGIIEHSYSSMHMMMLSSLSRYGARNAVCCLVARSGFVHRSFPVIECRRQMSIITLSDVDAVNKFTQLNSKCCIYYTADWCSPCRSIKPIYKDLAATYNGSIALGLVNVDDNPMAAAEAKVSAVPTFRLFKRSELTETFSGADENKLRASLSELASL
jgi:thioredoxin 1